MLSSNFSSSAFGHGSNKRFRDEGEAYAFGNHRKRIFTEDIDNTIQVCAHDLHQALMLHDRDMNVPSSGSKRRSDEVSEDVWDIDEQDDTQYVHSRRKPNPIIEQHPNIENECPEEFVDQIVFPRKTKQCYSSHADFLVDEVIRKHRKNQFRDPYVPRDFESGIPSAVGPHPATDHALSVHVPSNLIAQCTQSVTPQNLAVLPKRESRAHHNNSTEAMSPTASHQECFEYVGEDVDPTNYQLNCWPTAVNSSCDEMEVENVTTDEDSSDDDVEDIGTF